MRQPAIIAAVLLSAAALGLPAQTTAAVPAATPASPPTAPVASADWTLGLARFGLAQAEDQPTTLSEILPRLIAADLKALPTRHTPDAAAEEIARRETIRQRFLSGADLASKLDARAARFFDPSLDADARKDALGAADLQIATATKKLAEVVDGKVGASPPSSDRPSRLWDGHAMGQLLDASSSKGLYQAAKAAGVDFVVAGTISLRAGYAIVSVKGFDAALEREVFAWKTFCSVDDPAPLAADLADRLERWVAGREFARVDLNLSPASAELRVNGELLSGVSPVIYSYSDASLRLEAVASGFSPRTLDLEVSLGDRKSLDLELEPLSTGTARIATDPPEAMISLDSMPIGKAPAVIGLDGSRGIVSASAAGRETENFVLPASGDSEIGIRLLPADGLGPSGRIGAAKDRFYKSLGWFVLCIPATTLSWGAYSGYDEAFSRSPTLPISVSRDASIAALAASATALAAAATVMVVRLVKYLGAAH